MKKLEQLLGKIINILNQFSRIIGFIHRKTQIIRIDFPYFQIDMIFT